MEQEIQPQQLAPFPPNNKKKMVTIVISLVAIVLIAISWFFIFSKRSVILTEIQQTLQQTNTTNWKTYSNSQYGFEIKHPSEWTPWEGFTVMYDSSLLPAVLRVCFGPEVQTKNYCGVELYVIRENQFPEINSNTFLGFPRPTEEETGYLRHPVFDEKSGKPLYGTAIETYDLQRPNWIIRNEFLKHDGFVYLLVAYNSEEFQKLQRIAASLTFLTPYVSESNQTDKVETDEWKTFKSGVLGYELKYPNTWGFAKQGDGLVDFGPGSPKPAGGRLQLDMQCLYGTETQIYGEETTSTKQQVSYGRNQFIEKKIFVVSGSEKRLSFHNFTLNLPDEYMGNQCKTASFIVREEFDQNILESILSTFELVK